MRRTGRRGEALGAPFAGRSSRLERQLGRIRYGSLWTEPESLIHHGPPEKLAEELAAYEESVDLLILFLEIPRLEQVERLAEHVLPRYADAG